MVRRSTIVYTIFAVVGTSFTLIGVTLYFAAFPSIIDKQINKNLALKPDTDQSNRFIDSPVPIYFSFYIFNVTNKEEVNMNGSKANLQELGPYVFREQKHKEISAWDEELGTVRYKERRTYHFEPSMTVGKLSDNINHINAVSIGLRRNFLKFASFLIKEIRGELVETHTAEELMFSGYSMKEYFPSIIAPLCILKDKCEFAFYIGKNGTTGKDFEVSSGILGMDDYTEVKRYDKKSKLKYWYGDTCNAINGTDGLQFPPGLTKEQTPYVFSDDVCRSLKFAYDEDITVEGIDALRFVVPAKVFADPNKVKTNMCFCHKDASVPCPSKAGVIPLFNCQNGNPVMASSPHFYQGDPEYWQAYGGLNPNKEKHQTFLDVEPMTGTVIQAAKRIQISILVEPDINLPCVKYVKEPTYFPAFWVQEGGQIDTKSANEFRQRVLTPYRAGKWSLISMSIFGGAILHLIAGLYTCRRSKQKMAPYSDLKEETPEESAVSIEPNVAASDEPSFEHEPTKVPL